MKKNKIDLKVVKAINKNVRSSTRKLSPILKSIVGKKADEALRDLSFSEKRISKDIKKTIRSINNNIRSSVRKLNPILRGIVGKKVDVAIKDLQFSGHTPADKKAKAEEEKKVDKK